MDKEERPEPDDIQLPEFDYPEYPNWKRGLKWGLYAGIPVSLPALSLLVFRSEPLLVKIFYVLIIVVLTFLIVGSIGAFRPDWDKK
ncbi:MAG: hypothetical protein WCV67_01755 [Victivallaceae bacterium]|jgi:hypothetical protein